MRVWLALIIAPVLALADQSVALSMASWACAHQGVAVMHATHFVFLVAVATATLLAWQALRGSLAGPESAEVHARRRFLAALATASGAFCTLVVIALWAPTWILSPCFA